MKIQSENVSKNIMNTLNESSLKEEKYTVEEQEEYEEALEKIRTALQLLTEARPVIKLRKGSWGKFNNGISTIKSCLEELKYFI